MLKGIKIMKGTIGFEPGKYHEEQILFDVMRMVEHVISHHFDSESYQQTVRKGFRLAEPVMNTDELHTTEFRLGSSVVFYSHSKTLDIPEMKRGLEEMLERLVDPTSFNGVRIALNYHEIVFSDSSPRPEYVRENEEYLEIIVNEAGDTSVSHDVYSQESILYLDAERLINLSNLLVIDVNKADGMRNLVEHLAIRHQEMDKTIEGSRFENKQTELVAKLFKEKVISEADDEQMIRLVNILDGTLASDYLIGESELLDYMNKVSPIILRDAMTGNSF